MKAQPCENSVFNIIPCQLQVMEMVFRLSPMRPSRRRSQRQLVRGAVVNRMRSFDHFINPRPELATIEDGCRFDNVFPLPGRPSPSLLSPSPPSPERLWFIAEYINN